MNFRDSTKYLVGSVAVYLVMAACSGGSGGGGRRLAGEMAGLGGESVAFGGQPLHEGGQPTVGASDMGGMLGLAGIMNPVPVANADPIELCAACRGSSLQTVTAETDPQQEATDVATLGAAPLNKRSTAKVADGPLFLVYADNPDLVNYYTVLKDESCSFDAAGDQDDVSGEDSGGSFAPDFAAHHKPAGVSLARNGSSTAKLRVFSNEKLCVSQVADCSCQVSPAPKSAGERKLRWFGYRPYE